MAKASLWTRGKTIQPGASVCSCLHMAASATNRPSTRLPIHHLVQSIVTSTANFASSAGIKHPQQLSLMQCFLRPSLNAPPSYFSTPGNTSSCLLFSCSLLPKGSQNRDPVAIRNQLSRSTGQVQHQKQTRARLCFFLVNEPVLPAWFLPPLDPVASSTKYPKL